VNRDMATDPDQIRSEITSLLAVLPEPDAAGADVEDIAERLEQAHDLLVQALESVDRSAATGEVEPAGRSAATGEVDTASGGGAAPSGFGG
jgi:hypothetical protein